jgi:hypothetical protein
MRYWSYWTIKEMQVACHDSMMKHERQMMYEKNIVCSVPESRINSNSADVPAIDRWEPG